MCGWGVLKRAEVLEVKVKNGDKLWINKCAFFWDALYNVDTIYSDRS